MPSNLWAPDAVNGDMRKPAYINGELSTAGSSVDVINPATTKIVGSVPASSPGDIERALQGAQAAFPKWSTIEPAQRAQWMHKLRDAVVKNEAHLRDCVHQEMAKPWAATADDFNSLVDSLNYYADLTKGLAPEALVDRHGTHVHSLHRQPVGVVGAFLAWNFPLLNLGFKLGPAMASGCPVVIKPSSKTPLSAHAVGQLCHDIGVPAGVVNIVSGDDQGVGDAISRSPIPAMLTLIGSTQTGMHVMRTGASSIKRYSMELGGNAPALVFADADLDIAAQVICELKFGNAGQVCVAPNRVFVEQSVAKELIDKVVVRAKNIVSGFDRTAAIDMGPVIDMAAWERIDALVRNAVDSGAKLLTGGERPAGLTTGSFYAPTVLTNASDTMSIFRDEVFGPVVSITTFDNEEEVLRRANDTDAGLAAYVFTDDTTRAQRCAAQLHVGEVQINGVRYDISLPHGGVKQSGIGVDCSRLALDEYFAHKRVSTALRA